jgi:hypothetical protein
VADLLEQSEEFEKDILYLREKYNIPKNGYPYGTGFYYEDQLENNIIEAIYDDSDVITKKLKLPLYWSGTISFFAIYNQFLTPERVSMWIHYLGSSDESSFLNLIPNETRDKSVFIEIREKLSKEQLHQLIDQEWEEIKKGMDLNLFEMPQHRMVRASLARRIVEMRDKIEKGKAKIKFGDIVGVLQKENQDNDLYDILSEDYVKNLYHRWKNKKTIKGIK